MEGQSDDKKQQPCFDVSDDELSDLECNVCRKEFRNVKALEQHLNSQKHYKMLMKNKVIKKSKTLEGATDETNDVSEDEDDSQELHCSVCDITAYGYQPYTLHLKGSTHAKNVKKQILKKELKDVPGVLTEQDLEKDESYEDEALQKPFARCDLCDKRFLDPRSYKMHLKGNTHKKKTLERKTHEKLKDEFPEMERGDEFRCPVCKNGFTSSVSYQMHLQGSQHAKRIKRVQMEKDLIDFYDKDSDDDKLICKECKGVFPGPVALKTHLESDAHLKQKEKKNIFDFVALHPEIVAVKSVSGQEESEDEAKSDPSSYQIGHFFLVCKFCHVSSIGIESAQAHVASKKHQSALAEREARKSLAKKNQSPGKVSTPHTEKDDFELI